MASTEFDLLDFTEHPSWDKLEKIKKCDWLSLAEHYEVSFPGSSKLTKKELNSHVSRYLIDNGILQPLSLEGEGTPLNLEEIKMPVQPKPLSIVSDGLSSDPSPSFLPELEKYKLELQFSS